MAVFNIHHVTRYTYNSLVKESVNEIKLYPYQDRSQEILLHEIHVSSDPEILLMMDYWGNRSGMFNIMTAHDELVVESKLIIRQLGINNAVASITTFNDLQAAIRENYKLLELAQPNQDSRKEIFAITGGIVGDETNIASIITACSDYIFTNFSYVKGITTVETTVEQILSFRSGVCQDFAHLLLEMLRSVRIPCRYVSGYICPNKNGMRGEGATHAWIEAYVPGHGWVGNDPTNNVWVTDKHVKLAVGRHYADCAPLKGTYKGIARETLSVYVSVGYEDGSSFEDLSNVNMQAELSSDRQAEMDALAAQQQQQQQQ